MDLIEFIKSEHQYLLSFFDSNLSSCKTKEDWLQFITKIKELFEDNHHKKEEELIFTKIQNNPKIQAGGPMCTFYFDAHMTQPSIEYAQVIIKKYSNLDIKPEWNEILQKEFLKNSPLIIPGGDHEAGRMLLRGAEHVINSQNENWQQKTTSILSAYKQIQERHFSREENCFLRMCKELLSPSDWNQLNLEVQSKYPALNQV